MRYDARMITGLVLADAGEEALAITLGALVPAVVVGLMGDAVVIARREDPAFARIAEVSGAAIVVVPGTDNPWRAGGAAARREWLFCLAAGDVPAGGWMRAVDRFLTHAQRHNQPLGRFPRRPRAAGATIINLAERFAGTRTVR